MAEQRTYRSRKLVIEDGAGSEGAPRLSIDDEPVATERSEATGNFWAPELPYQHWASLADLGQALIDHDLR
jgi:hypothetical protein